MFEETKLNKQNNRFVGFAHKCDKSGRIYYYKVFYYHNKYRFIMINPNLETYNKEELSNASLLCYYQFLNELSNHKQFEGLAYKYVPWGICYYKVIYYHNKYKFTIYKINPSRETYMTLGLFNAEELEVWINLINKKNQNHKELQRTLISKNKKF